MIKFYVCIGWKSDRECSITIQTWRCGYLGHHIGVEKWYLLGEEQWENPNRSLERCINNVIRCNRLKGHPMGHMSTQEIFVSACRMCGENAKVNRKILASSYRVTCGMISYFLDRIS